MAEEEFDYKKECGNLRMQVQTLESSVKRYMYERDALLGLCKFHVIQFVPHQTESNFAYLIWSFEEKMKKDKI